MSHPSYEYISCMLPQSILVYRFPSSSDQARVPDLVQAGWRHPAEDADNVARLHTMLTNLADVLKESEELFSYLQKAFRLVQHSLSESRQGPPCDCSGSSTQEDAPCVNEDRGEWDGVEIRITPTNSPEFVKSESIRSTSERVWAASTVLSSLEAELDLKRRVVSAVSQTLDITPGAMQAYTMMWQLQPHLDSDLVETAAKMQSSLHTS